MNKKVFVIFPIAVMTLSLLIFLSLGANQREHFEMPVLFSIVILLFIKVRKYNKNLKKEHALQKGGKITTNLQKEQEGYKLLQRTLNYLIFQMVIIYLITIAIIAIIF